MAGNSRSGPGPRQIDARQRLDPNDVPQRPDALAGHSAAFWADVIVPCAHLVATDTTLAVECCRQYDLYRRAVVACEQIPLDDEAAKTAGKHFDRWQQLVKLLCLDPLGKMRGNSQTRRDGKDEAIDKESAMFGVVG